MYYQGTSLFGRIASKKEQLFRHCEACVLVYFVILYEVQNLAPLH